MFYTFISHHLFFKQGYAEIYKPAKLLKLPQKMTKQEQTGSKSGAVFDVWTDVRHTTPFPKYYVCCRHNGGVGMRGKQGTAEYEPLPVAWGP